MESDPEATADTDPGAAVLDAPAGWSDSLTGVDGPRYWDRILASEQARISRYGGTATVVLLELNGFDELAAWLGRDGAGQAFARLSRVLAGQIRASDHIARIGANRFGILLVATSEVQTVNFVNRVLERCDRAIGSGRSPVRVEVGWASPAVDQSLIEAIPVAEERLRADFFGVSPARVATSPAPVPTPGTVLEGVASGVAPPSPTAASPPAADDRAGGSARDVTEDPWTTDHRGSSRLARVAFLVALSADVAVALAWCNELAVGPFGLLR
jgi:diguanylate cyclase (GGDEF)-like protein